MPRGDGTGPMGMGAMTGRAAGFCAGSGMAGYANPAPGMGYGMRFGRGRGFGGGGGRSGGGRGWRHMFYATGLPGWLRPFGYPTPQATRDPQLEKQVLQNQADALKAELDLLTKRLSEIESETAAD